MSDSVREIMQIACYGGGVNSTAMLIGMVDRGESCEFITFADTGAERPETYQYVDMFSEWLVNHGYPLIVIVRNDGIYGSLEENCLQRRELPSLAYGWKSCSDKYKRRPQEKYMKEQPRVLAVWSLGERVVKCVGYDADESRRIPLIDDPHYVLRYPLIEWNMGRAECVAAIRAAGIPVPGKSACFFCPASKKAEIIELREKHPDLLKRALELESLAIPNLGSVRGLGRRFAWRDLILADCDQVKFDFATPETPCDCYDG